MSARYVVRYGQMRFLGEFDGADGAEHARGQRVVVRSDRGTEVGEVLCAAGRQTDQAMEGAPRGEILRALSPDDEAAAAKLPEAQARGFSTCLDFIARRRLQMDLVDVEVILGRERMVFYYLAERRVDFRELVKDLARAFQTRIEMRQIGVRDEAKALGGYGTCGRPLCCTTFLTSFEPVSIKMAKQQDLSLNPSKLSGLCGRLKCCLRYELPNAKGEVHGGCGSEGRCDNPSGCGTGSCGAGGCSSGSCRCR